MLIAERIREVYEQVDRLLGCIVKKQAVIPVIEECEHLLSGICALVVGEIPVIFVVLNEGKECRNSEYSRSSAVRDVTVVRAVRDPRDLNKERDDHVLVVIGERRVGECLDHVRIRSEEFVEAEILIEICGDRIPPVEKEILERYVVLIEVCKRSLKVRQKHRILVLALNIIAC